MNDESRPGSVERVQAGAPRSSAETFGFIFLLLTQSKLHRLWRVVDIERYVAPALQYNQFRMYFDSQGVPFGYVSWAWLSKETEERYLAGGYTLQPRDWKQGDRPWFIDWIAPRGGTRLIVKDLKAQRDELWKRTPVKAIRPNRTGPGQKIVQFGFLEDRQKTGWETKEINRHLG